MCSVLPWSYIFNRASFSESPKLKMLWAAEKGDLNLVKSLLDGDESLLDARDPDGYSPLHRASYEGHIDVVRVSIP